MKPKTNIDNEFCLNKECHDYGKIKVGNIQKYGRDRNGKQRFKCKTCEKVYTETKGTIFYNRKGLTKKDIILICRLLVEKNGIRAIERITEHHRDTISDLVTDLATHAEKITNFLLNDVKIEETELDEFWTFVKKSKRNLPTKILKNLEIAGDMSR